MVKYIIVLILAICQLCTSLPLALPTQFKTLKFMLLFKCHCIALAVLGGNGEVENHLQLGKKYLQEGQLSEALYHYSAAVGESVAHARPAAAQVL